MHIAKNRLKTTKKPIKTRVYKVGIKSARKEGVIEKSV